VLQANCKHRECFVQAQGVAQLSSELEQRLHFMPRLSNASQEINRAAPRSDRPAITPFKSRSWSCSGFHFDVFGQPGLLRFLLVVVPFLQADRSGHVKNANAGL